MMFRSVQRCFAYWRNIFNIPMMVTSLLKKSYLRKLLPLCTLAGGTCLCLLVMYGSSFGSEVDYQIQFWESRQTRDPHDYIALTKLGTAYLQKSRETADSTYIQKSIEILERALSLKNDHYSALVSLAFAFGAQHKFPQAITVAEKAKRLHATEPEAYGILGDALFERGDILGARKMYATLHTMSPGLFSLTRLANLEFMEGNTSEALEHFTQAITIGKERNVPTTEIARCHVQIGEIYFLQGRFEKAEQSYQAALNVWPAGYLPLEHLAELRALQGDYERSLALYQQVLEAAPNPEFYEAIGDVHALMDQPDKADHWYQRARDAYQRYVNQGGIGYFRHLALLSLKTLPPNPTESLQWAKKDVEIRQDVYTYDTLAWAYYHNQLLPEALEAITNALALGTQDATLFFHAGMIHHRLGNQEQANTWLKKTLTTNPKFPQASLVKEMLAISTTTNRS